MTQAKGILSGGRVLAQWIRSNASQGRMIQSLFDGVNTLSANIGSSAVGRVPAPQPIQGLNVSTGGEYAHVTFNDSGEVQQGKHYWLEVANNDQFVGAHPIHFGGSRTRDPIHLAPMDAQGNTQKWFMRGFSQYIGGDPSQPINYGGETPTPIVTTGSTQLSWSPSTGSGTASNSGQQIGAGWGKVQRRPSGNPNSK